MARLVIEDQQTLTNEPLPLNLCARRDGGRGCHLTGLAEGTRLSAGEAVGGSGWRVRRARSVTLLPIRRHLLSG